MENVKIAPRLTLGFLIVIIGTLLLLSNLGIIDFIIPNIIFSWQVLMIIIGAIIIISFQNQSTGLVLVIVGTLALIPEYWAIALILLGIYIIFRKNGYSRSIYNTEGTRINEISVFGGGKKYFYSDICSGGNVTAIFGGSEIDMSDCKLAKGKNVINLLYIFGGSSFRIPSDWQVQIETTSIFGKLSDQRALTANTKFDEERVLIFRGLILFGNSKIKNL